MPNTKKIYQNEAERYHALVAREDMHHNLLPAILKIDPLLDKDVIELGAGTGRLSALLAPLTQLLVISDVSFPMLSLGKKQLMSMGVTNWQACLESHHALPFADKSADIIIAGWSFCYAAIDAGFEWGSGLKKALSEAKRVLRPGGKLILIESLGTGYESPHAPPVLVDYLGYLNTYGFTSDWIRTDYCFRDQAEAEHLTTFFFGDDPMQMWETEEGVIVPECTGVWWKVMA